MDRSGRSGSRKQQQGSSSVGSEEKRSINKNRNEEESEESLFPHGDESRQGGKSSGGASSVARMQGSNNEDEDADSSPLLSSLLEHLVELAHEAGFPEELIEVPKARLLLEATAGRVELAAQLYWDDVLARTHDVLARTHQPVSQQAPPPRKKLPRRRLETQYDQHQVALDTSSLPPENSAASSANNEVNKPDGDRKRLDVTAMLVAAMSQQQQQQQQQQQYLRGRLDLFDVYRLRQQINRLVHHQQHDIGSDQPELRQPNENVALPDEEVEHEEQDDLLPEEGVNQRVMEPSVSISDDEAAAEILRTVKAVQKNFKISDNNRPAKKTLPAGDLYQPSNKRQRTTNFTENKTIHEEDSVSDGYLSDNDWIWESLSTTPRESIPPVPPMDLLWGVPGVDIDHSDSITGKLKDANHAKQDSLDELDREESNLFILDARIHDTIATSVDNAHNADNAQVDHLQNLPRDPNVNVEAPSHLGEDDEEDKAATIPVTWLRAGFSFADNLKLGLACKEPNEDDIGYLLWKQQITPSTASASANRNQALPPYHCRSLTLLPAIVTALMQAGVTVVQETNSPHVTCRTTQTPYYQLEPKARAQQWELRLIDALTALLVIAAQASKLRKAKALERAQLLEQQQHSQKIRIISASSNMSSVSASNTSKKGDRSPASSAKSSREGYGFPADGTTASCSSTAASAKWQKLWGKLQLCATCWWEKAVPNNANNNGQQGKTYVFPNPEEAFTIPLSYTHICDLKTYVKSNLDAFLGTGGCALFLETVLRIHGKGAVQRMVHSARLRGQNMEPGKKSEKLPPLIFCTCQERFLKEKHNLRMSSWPGAAKSATEETKNGAGCQHQNDCASVELISLLLTGRVYSSWQGWSTSMTSFAKLGIGVLTDRPGEVGRSLTRPLKPIWIVKGPTQYSVLWLNERNSAGVLDSQGFVANLSHWSCWYSDGHHFLTDVRFVAGKADKDKRADAVRVGFETSFSKEMEAVSEENLKSRTLELLQKQKQKELQAAFDLKISQTVEEDHFFTQSELDRVRVHPDDIRYYDNFRLWRYDIRSPGGKAGSNDVTKVCGERWTPFHRLDEMDKMLVETKLGPKLAVILRTRWPGGRIDSMEPAKPLPLV